MQIITKEMISTALEQHNIRVTNIRRLTGGSNHIVFSADSNNGKSLIIKFPTVRETEHQFNSGSCDTMFGGLLSLEREAYLFELIRQAGLPSPEVFGIIPTPAGNCIVVERCAGCNMMDFMKSCDHSLPIFLELMTNLGKDFKKLHTTRFQSFGNIMDGSVIDPAGYTNFADRYCLINNMLLEKCKIKGGLSHEEFLFTQAFFDEKFKQYYNRLNISCSPATLVITDLHGNNFFVKDSKISGYFDVESSQAAPWEFELYALRFFIFNYYSQEEYQLAEKAFWLSYFDNTRLYPDVETSALIDFFSACRLLEIFQSYWGYKDGLRDNWGQKIKDFLFHYMNTGYIDYYSLGEIWRERDGQPLHAKKD